MALNIKEMMNLLDEDELEYVKEYIVDRFTNIITEMAFDRKIVIKKAEGLERQINLHLIKIIRYNDALNYNKHLKNIKGWLQEIQDMDVNKADKKIARKRLL